MRIAIWATVTALAATLGFAPSASASAKVQEDDLLASGSSLRADEFVTSDNGKFRLYQQKDGNVVLRRGTTAVWSTGTSGKGVFTTMQRDGNLVVRDASDKALWTSNTGSNGAVLAVQDDGNIVIYSKTGKALWDRRTHIEGLMSGQSLKTDEYVRSRNGQYRLYQQKDGNVVLRHGTTAVWSTGTSGKGVFTTMQRDGNLVVRDASGEPLWSTGTSSPGALLSVQDDGNVVIYGKAGQAVWDRD
ncbi:hypothetical protein [Sphaerisporangium corydalis]|uniref:Bulb-type lectin domain-containing protein n=1 Tax=Sphaerisporangium corydalis TaxID=1441875 RepID=A0ABV9EAT9_9ACTN|nr:hypothetical protein [Sphaerisporangium corydalis]